MLPYVTADCAPVKAEVRKYPEDTTCEEVLRRKPEGGGHFWIKVRKKGLPTSQARAAVARAAGVEAEHIAFAGHRDRHSDSIQWFSVAKDLVDNPGQLSGAVYNQYIKLQALQEGRRPVNEDEIEHLAWTSKLRGGAADNGFRKAQAILRVLRNHGCPNFFGAASIGNGPNFIKWGRLLTQGKRLPSRINGTEQDRRRWRAAFQAQMFNWYVMKRIEDKTFAHILGGDIVRTNLGAAANKQGMATVTDIAAMQKRMDSWEVAPCGPLFGKDFTPADDEAGAYEEAVLERAEVSLEAFTSIRGGRRPIRFRPSKVLCDMHKEDLILQVTLPVDVHLPVLLAEFTHPENPLS